MLALGLLAAASPVDLATASPDAPALELGWRDGLRAKGGGRIRLLGSGEDRTGVALDFHGFIELHNARGSGSFVPYQYWRGRFALEGGYRWRFDGLRAWTFRLIGGLEHESDHATAQNTTGSTPDVGFVNLNDVALTAGVRHGAVAPTHAALTLRAHVLTCTRSRLTCGRGGGLAGDPTFEAELTLTQELALWGALERWNVFASMWGNVLVPTPLISRSRRLAIRAGVIRQRSSDAFSIFFQALVGTDLGFFRQTDTVQAGLGVAWVLD